MLRKTEKANITVLGAGGWGLALAIMAHQKGHNVTVWSFFEDEINEIRRFGENRKRLPGVPVPPEISLTCDINCVKNATLVILAIPSIGTVDIAKKIHPLIDRDTIVVNSGKGLDSHSNRRFSELLCEIFPHNPVGALSGPSHAEEVARRLPTSIIISSNNIKAAEEVQHLLMNPNFRIYVNDDIIGVELGGALKNIIALAAGICDGLDLGDNAKAALMTRGLAEISRLGIVFGAKESTFAGLSGMGDLIVTCGSLHSRNRRAGMLIGQGKTPQEAVEIVGTVEGYHATKAGFELSQAMNIEMPITALCYAICYEGQDPRKALVELMTRPKKHESEQDE